MDVEKKDIITVFNQVRWINMKKKNKGGKAEFPFGSLSYLKNKNIFH